MDEEHTDTRSIILQAIQETKNSLFFEKCYFIHELTKKGAKAKKVLQLLNNEEFMRELKQLEAINKDEENEIYYYGKDEQSPKKLHYRTTLEEQIRTNRQEQLRELAKTLAELNEEEEFDL